MNWIFIQQFQYILLLCCVLRCEVYCGSANEEPNLIAYRGSVLEFMALLRRIVVLIIWKYYTRNTYIYAISRIRGEVFFPLFTTISNVSSGHLLQALESWGGGRTTAIIWDKI